MTENTNQLNIESTSNGNDKGYLLLLNRECGGGDGDDSDGGGVGVGNDRENKVEDDHYLDVEFSDISQLNSTITILQKDTIKTHLRHMITNTHGSKTIENILSRNGKRSSSFPSIFEKLTDCMMQNTIHSVSLPPLQQSQVQYIDLSKHNSRIPARDMYNKSTKLEDSNNDYFLFGFSPETEILKNLIAVINIVSSLFVSGIKILERDVQKRSDILCQPGHEIEYAQILRDVKQLNSISTATLNFISNSSSSTLTKTCPCCRSKSHTRSPLIDAFEPPNVTSAAKKRQNNILIPPELIFKGIQSVVKGAATTTASLSSDIDLQSKQKKSNKRIKSVINKQVKNVLNNTRDISYEQKYRQLEMLNRREIKQNTISKTFYSNNKINSDSSSNNMVVSSLEPTQEILTTGGGNGDDGSIAVAAADRQLSNKKYLNMRDGQQRHEIINFIKFT